MPEPLAMPSRSWRDFAPPAARLRLAFVTALVLFIYWEPIRHTMISRWISDGNWSHGWLIPAFSIYFLASKREELLCCPMGSSYVGAVIVALSLGAFFFSARGGRGWPIRRRSP